MYIEGKPGSGKSTLLRYFTDHFEPPVYGAIVAKFFYSYRDEALGRNHKNMLRHLLHQILKKDESLFMHFQEEYRNLRGPDVDQPPKAWECGKLKGVLRACLKHPLKRSFFLIIDAINESDVSDRADIVNFLRELSMPADANQCAVKVFLASRPINEIHRIIIPDVHQRIRLQEKNIRDIEEYTYHLLKKPIFSHYENDNTRERIKNYIVKNADGVFLWVRLVGDELVNYCIKDLPVQNFFADLKPLPQELEGYYENILQGLNGGDESDARDGIRILQFCLFSHRQIELLELCDALAIPGEMPPRPLDPAPLSWGSNTPENIGSRLTACTGGFVEAKTVSSKLAGSNGSPYNFF